MDLPRLMLVTDRGRTRGRDLVDLVSEAAQGGVGLIQVREKDLRDDELRELVTRIRARVPEETMIVVNGRIRVARTQHTGLHLAAVEPPAGADAHRVSPLGRSVHNGVELQRALADRPDYLVAGSVFSTDSKPGAVPAGLSFLESVCRQVAPLPVFGIGGLTIARVPALIHAGAHGIAVCGAILESNTPGRIAQALKLGLDVAGRARTRR